MKKLISASTLAILAAGASLPAAAVEGLSANVGFVSDYYYRGSNLGDGGAYGGIDYETSGFYIGAWAIDDGTAGNDGLEYDLYTGFGMEHGKFSWNIGYTRYEYTYTTDFEHEINLGLGLAGFGLNLDFGQDEDDGADAIDYAHAALSWSGEVLGATVGYVTSDDDDDDNDYAYAELSAGTEVSGLSLGATIGVKQDGYSGPAGGQDDGYIVLDISKSFDI